MPRKKLDEEAKIHFRNGKEAFEKSQSEKAFQELSKALQFYLKTSEFIVLAEIHRMLGELYFNKGKQIDSRNHYKRAYQAFQNFNNKIGMADCYDKVALSFMIQNELEHAEDYQKKAIDIRKKTPDKKGLARGLKNLAIIKYRLNNDADSALKILQKATELLKKVKAPQLTINIHIDKYKILLNDSRFEESLQSLLIAKSYGKKFEISLPEDIDDDFGKILLNLGLSYYEKGNKKLALKYLKNAKLVIKDIDEEILESIENIIVKLEK